MQSPFMDMSMVEQICTLVAQGADAAVSLIAQGADRCSRFFHYNLQDEIKKNHKIIELVMFHLLFIECDAVGFQNVGATLYIF